MAVKLVPLGPGLFPWILALWISSFPSHQQCSTFFYLTTTADTWDLPD